jgi:hypothetical protein
VVYLVYQSDGGRMYIQEVVSQGRRTMDEVEQERMEMKVSFFYSLIRGARTRSSFGLVFEFDMVFEMDRVYKVIVVMNNI